MKFAATLILACLSACGPVVQANNTPAYITPAPREPTFRERDQDRQNLLNNFATLDVTPATRLPFQGRLHYDGQLNAALGSRADVIGDLRVEVDLGREEIRGRAGNFVNRFNNELDGELELFNGTFDETPRLGEYQSQVGVRGTLRDGFSRNYAISGQLEGDLLGQNAQGYEAVLTGAVKVNGGRQEPVKGGAVATRSQ